MGRKGPFSFKSLHPSSFAQLVQLPEGGVAYLTPVVLTQLDFSERKQKCFHISSIFSSQLFITTNIQSLDTYLVSMAVEHTQWCHMKLSLCSLPGDDVSVLGTKTCSENFLPILYSFVVYLSPSLPFFLSSFFLSFVYSTFLSSCLKP